MSITIKITIMKATREIRRWIFANIFLMTLIKYSLVKWTSNSYTLWYSHKIGVVVIKVGELVCDAVYFIPVANIKQCYNIIEIKETISS